MATERINTLECFVKDGDQYLMLRRSDDKKILPRVWMAPGGKREFNEGLFACAQREVREETGLEIVNLNIIAHGNGYMRDIDMEVYFHFVTAVVAGGQLLEHSPDGELRWVTYEEMLRLPNLLAELSHILPLVLPRFRGTLSYRTVYSVGNLLESIEIENP